MKSRKRFAALATTALAVSAAAVVAGSISGPAAARPDRTTATTVRIWTDRNRKADVETVAGNWARSKGVTIEVVEKEFGDIKKDLKTVKSDNAPDVILGAHDWTGELAADGSVVPIFLRKSVSKQLPAYTLQAFSYGQGASKLYGVPVQVENAALVVNTRLAHVPKNFADLEQQALKFKRGGSDRLAIDVQQGAGGDAYHMYPFFSGLCGYIFGRTKGGALNPGNIGIGSPKFLKNTALIDKWNKEGLINAKIDGDAAKNAFVSKKAAFWVTGPWNIENIRKAGIKFRVVQVPAIKCKSVPFLGAQGFFVTKFAAGHGVASAAKDLVTSYMAGATAQAALTAANNRYPANLQAAKKVEDSALKQFGQAGAGGVAMPNIPQMNSVWSDLGSAWVKSTKGAGATKAHVAFATAARNIRNAINSGG